MPTGLKTLAIILGASDWPMYESLPPSPAFASSATRFKNYLISETGLNVPQNNILDLFDQDLTPVPLIDRIRSFIEDHTDCTNLIFYYVGHGQYIQEREYGLAIRSTRKTAKDPSLFKTKYLVEILSDLAQDKHNLIILDACYSGAALSGFVVQSHGNAADATDVVSHDLEHLKTTVLFCAAGPRNWAKTQVGDELTMFSGSLLKVLETGDPTQKLPHLSLKAVAMLVLSEIKSRFGNEAVPPQIHVPTQGDRDALDIPYFPNPAIRMTESDVRLSHIESTLADIKTSLAALGSSFGELHRLCARRPENENFYTRVGILYGGAQNISSGVFTYNIAKIKSLGGYAPKAKRVLHIQRYDLEIKAYWVSVYTEYVIKNLFSDSDYEDLVTVSIIPDKLNKDIRVGKVTSIKLGEHEHIKSYCVIEKEGYERSFPIHIKEGSSNMLCIHFEAWFVCDEEQAMFPRRYVEHFAMKIINRCKDVAPRIEDLSDSRVIVLGYNNDHDFKDRTDVKGGEKIFHFRMLEP